MFSDKFYYSRNSGLLSLIIIHSVNVKHSKPQMETANALWQFTVEKKKDWYDIKEIERKKNTILPFHSYRLSDIVLDS